MNCMLMRPLAAGDSIGITFAIIVGGIFVLVMIAKVRELISPRQIGNRLRRFFGRAQFKQLQTHDKTFPGYDLGSVQRALDAYLQECCTDVRSLGACIYLTSLRDVLQPGQAAAGHRTSAPTFERLPVDIDREESFISNCIYVALVQPAPEATPEHRQKIAVLLSCIKGQAPREDDGLEAAATRAGEVTLSIACASQHVADHFFGQIERLRRVLSIFRGKAIDARVSNGGVSSIGFKRLHRVMETDLVLPESVRQMIKGAIVDFYRYQEALRPLGVEMKRGVLFHSLPGTGKTSVSLYLAGLLPEFTICFVSGRQLLYPRELCAMARYLQPAMLVFEDIDLVAQDRDMNGLATVLGELMNQIDGCEPNDQILFIMNTNSMDRIEEAVRNRPGRVDQIIHIPLPDKGARRQLLAYFARSVRVSDAVVDAVANATDGATPATLKEIVKRAAVGSIARGQNGNGSAIELSQADLLLAYEQIHYLRNAPGGGTPVL